MNSSVLSALAAFALLASSCDNIAGRQSRGPIVLNNPATIVTETDSLYLQDMVPDPAFEAPVAAAPARDTAVAATAPAKDTASTTPAPQPPVPAAPAGLTADFGNVQITLPGVEARPSSRSLKGATSAAFTLSDDEFSGKSILVSGGTVKRIQQRTGYSAVVEIGGKPVLLSDIGTAYTGWQSLNGKAGNYTLAATTPPAMKMSAATLRTAVQKAARKQRLDRKAEQKLLASAKGLSTPPLSMAPRAYTWKIDGTDASGKAFSKDVRIDVPL